VVPGRFRFPDVRADLELGGSDNSFTSETGGEYHIWIVYHVLSDIRTLVLRRAELGLSSMASEVELPPSDG
jgi:hypothetical protein